MATRKKTQNDTDFTDAVVHRAAILAASGMTQRAIARELGVSESQVSRWAKTAPYIATRNSVMLEAIDVASARLRALAASAVAVLHESMEDPKASPADRIRAAGIILDRVVGDAGKSTIGSTDEREIESRMKSAKAQADLNAQFDDIMAEWAK